MTQNKFWLVWNEAGNAPRKPHDTKEKAITEAKRLSAMYPQHAYIILEATHHFKANANVIETSFEETPEESLAVEPKFKVGDIVNISFYENPKSEILGFNGDNYYCVKNLSTSKINFSVPKEYVTLAEQETPTDSDKRCTPKREFKVGDRVTLKNDDWDTGVILKINIKDDAFIKWEKASGEYWYPLCDVVHA